MSCLVLVADVCDFGQTAQILVWAPVLLSVDGVGCPVAETQCHMSRQHWCHEDAKSRSVPAFTNLLSNVTFFLTSDHTHMHTPRDWIIVASCCQV